MKLRTERNSSIRSHSQPIRYFVYTQVFCYNKQMNGKIRVAVLRGGTSPEYETSLQTGGYVLNNLPEKYHGVDVLIDRNGVWHVGGLPKSPEAILRQSDVVWNALHGSGDVNGNM